MIRLIRSADRYHIENEWLSAYWHFSFDQYHDQANVSFGPLRVFNNDTIAPGGGFPAHPHREMEIVTYLIKGQIEHRDNMGNGGIVSAGEVQRMSAGTGIRHAEFNASDTEPAEIVQLWLFPATPQLKPSWEQKAHPLEERAGKLLPIAVPAAGIRGERQQDNNKPPYAVEIHQDATIYTSLLAKGQSVTHKLAGALTVPASPTKPSQPVEISAKADTSAEALAKAERRAYIFVISGELNLNGQTLHAGDQARVTGESELRLAGPSNGAAPADFLLLDLP
jgi:quercetin 2,3-dioxygenase